MVYKGKRQDRDGVHLNYMFVNNNTHPQLIKMSFMFLSTSNSLADMYVKLHKHVGFDGPTCTLKCSNVCKQFIICVNNNKPQSTL